MPKQSLDTVTIVDQASLGQVYGLSRKHFEGLKGTSASQLQVLVWDFDLDNKCLKPFQALAK